MKKLFVLLLLTVITVSSLSYAHPGRTDRRGGHYCRTNCKKRGLKTGQYHYH